MWLTYLYGRVIQVQMGQSWVTHVGSIGINKFIDIGQPVLFAVLAFGSGV